MRAQVQLELEPESGSAPVTVETNAERVGNEAPAVIYLGGFGDRNRAARLLLGLFEEYGLRVYIPQMSYDHLRGTGPLAPMDERVISHGPAVVSVISRELLDNQEFTLLGHSQGGGEALIAAHALPDLPLAGVGVISPATGANVCRSHLHDLAGKEYRVGHEIVRLCARFAGNVFLQSPVDPHNIAVLPGIIRQVYEEISGKTFTGKVGTALQWKGFAPTIFDLTTRDVPVPVSLVLPKHDPVIGYRYVLASLAIELIKRHAQGIADERKYTETEFDQLFHELLRTVRSDELPELPASLSISLLVGVHGHPHSASKRGSGVLKACLESLPLHPASTTQGLRAA